MKAFFAGVVMVALFALGIVQFGALVSFFHNWFDGYMFLSVVFASFITGIPLLATILGILGAVNAWGMNVFLAILLFCPLLIIYIPMILGIPVAIIFDKIKNFGKNVQ